MLFDLTGTSLVSPGLNSDLSASADHSVSHAWAQARRGASRYNLGIRLGQDSKPRSQTLTCAATYFSTRLAVAAAISASASVCSRKPRATALAAALATAATYPP